ncbi:MAG: AraC family transcriptional regulator [Butyrivibrio sp.]|jgi:AraC-like DNA-binding protein|nr:AraC family transcriptional regulator [Butyrivibrio sp.]
MRTIVPKPELDSGSWAEDLTPSQEMKQKYMYVQCIGHFYTNAKYSVINRSNVHSYLLLYTQSGNGVLKYMDRIISLTPGTAIMIDCDKLHSYYCAPDCLWNFYWLHFSGTCIEGYLQEIVDSCHIIRMDLMKRFHDIYDLSKESDNITHIIQTSTAIITLCSDILINIRTSRSGSEYGISPVIRNSITYMEEKMTSKLSLDEICSQLGISKFYFSHLFKAQTGLTPTDYLTNLRLSYAKSLLRSTSMSISEIADSSGYSGSNYFIQHFKKNVGMTPLAYRREFLMISSN